jgi:hypothetical protein
MRLRLVGGALLAAAALVQLAVTRPARAALVRAEDEQRRLRDERRELMRRLTPAERLEGARQHALVLLAAAPPAEGREAPALRHAVLSRLAGVPVHSLHVSVQPARGSSGGGASLACEGSLEAVLQASSELLRTGSGFVVSRARLAPAATGMQLELDLTALRRRQ